MMSKDSAPLLSRTAHAAHCKRCLSGLPGTQVEADSSRIALGFYCLGTMDLLGLLDERTNPTDREQWSGWIWEQHTTGKHGTGFKPSSYMTPQRSAGTTADYGDFDLPHVIMTYTALLSLAILRDDFARLDRRGLIQFLRSCQREDGSFSTVPQSRDSDLRTVYCAFAISAMLDDWTGVDVDRALGFIRRCRTYEGGYGQEPFCEASGGPTYIALAALYLAPSSRTSSPLTPSERRATIRWLIQNQDDSGGFRGRTGKIADACYCFWCGASLQILGEPGLVNVPALKDFVAQCQFKYGGIAKAPWEHPDPYHTYLSLAALSLHAKSASKEIELLESLESSWTMEPLDALINARVETAEWAKKHIPAPKKSFMKARIIRT